MAQITPSGSNKLASPGLNTRSAQAKTTYCDLGCNTNNCTPFSQLCPGCPIRISPTRTDGTTCLVHARGSILLPAFFDPTLRRPDQPHGHAHDGVSHRIRVNVADLNTTLNQAQPISRKRNTTWIRLSITWCQAHPGQCNMYNNASYRQFLVFGTTNFSHFPLLAWP